MSLDVVDYKMDVYKVAMCDPSNGGTDAFFRLEHSSKATSVPHDKVHLFFPFFHNIKMRAIPCHLFFFPYNFFHKLVFLICIVLLIGIIRHRELVL